jgi:SAM-dependent methyltransferase
MCGSEGSELIAEEVSGAPDARVYRCRDCDIVYLHPIMSPDEEGKFYEKEFPSYMEARVAPGGADAEAHFRSNLPEAERRTALVRPFLSRDMSVLEVGSATGYFLFALQGYVSAVTGVEPGRTFAEYARGRGIRTMETLNDLKGERFDAILLYYVLEHMRHPVAFLSDLRMSLKPGGRLMLEVPNVHDALLSVYGIPAFGPFYFQKAHYYYFSRKTLKDALLKSGYTPEIYPVQRYDLSNHVHWMMAGRPGGKGKYRHIFSDTLEVAYAEALKGQWVCDTLFAVALAKQDGVADD